MSKIIFDDILENFEVALAQKKTNAQDVINAIIDNDLANKFVNIQTKKGQIKSLDDLYEYRKEIKSFFDEVCKIITAPGVQKFIDWIDELDLKSKESKATKYINEVLIDNYASYDERIKSILRNKNSIEPNSSLFENIKKAVRENINKRISTSFTSKENVLEDLPGFITDLDDLLIGISEIDELTYCNIKDFYTNNIKNRDDEDYNPEIDENADYFYDLIKQVVEKKDFLTTDKDKIQLSIIVENVQSSIADIRKSIKIIKTIELPVDSDENITTLYNKFEKSLRFNNVENVSDFIQDSINDTWEKTINAYRSYITFYSEFDSSKVIKLKSSKDRWSNFEFADLIDNYISNIEIINNDNLIDSIKTDDITKIKSRFTKAEKKIRTLADDNPKEKIVEYFTNITSDFENKKIEILKKLKTDNSKIDEIETAIGEIKSFIGTINDSNNLLDALNDDFISGILGSFEHMKKQFTSAIEKSDMKDDLEYLDKISNNEYMLKTTDLDTNLERFKRLLEYDLINIKLTKNI